MRAQEERNKFQQFCIENGYTAQDIAITLGLSKKTIYAYYAGDRYPSRKTMRAMEEKLGIDTKEIFN